MRNKNILVVTVVIVLPTFLQACTYQVTSSATDAISQPDYDITLHVNKNTEFRKCLGAMDGVCPVRGNPSALWDTSASASDGSGQIVPIPFEAPDFEYTVDDAYLSVESQDATIARQQSALIAVAANSALDVIKHDITKQLIALVNDLRGAGQDEVFSKAANTMIYAKDGNARNLVFPASSVDSFQKSLEQVTLIGGWDAIGMVREKDEDKRVRNQYLAAYFKAYFRDGKFFQLEVNPAEVTRRLVDKLKAELPGVIDENQNGSADDEYEELVRKLFPETKNGKYVFGKIAENGLVTRGGTKVAFPGIEVSASLGSSKIETPEIEYMVVGTDLIRVFLHALFDSYLRTPAVSNATGAGEAIEDAAARLKIAGQNSPSQFHVTEEQFADIEMRAAQVEGVISAGTGRLIRGISLFALNNEAIATAIETAIGVAARKPVEKVMWCWYECGMGSDSNKGFLALSNGEELPLTIRVSEFERDVTASQH